MAEVMDEEEALVVTSPLPLPPFALSDLEFSFPKAFLMLVIIVAV